MKELNNARVMIEQFRRQNTSLRFEQSSFEPVEQAQHALEQAIDPLKMNRVMKAWRSLLRAWREGAGDGFIDDFACDYQIAINDLALATAGVDDPSRELLANGAATESGERNAAEAVSPVINGNELGKRLDLAEHSLRANQRKLFEILRDMKPHKIGSINCGSETNEATLGVAKRLRENLAQSYADYSLVLDIKGESLILIDS